LIVIADAGPLIAFFDAKCESFLELAFSELIIPQARESGVYLPAVTFTVQEVRKTRREAPP
jgi:hypothetical protein